MIKITMKKNLLLLLAISFLFSCVPSKDIIYFDKASSHRIEINKEPYHVIRQENVVVVL